MSLLSTHKKFKFILFLSILLISVQGLYTNIRQLSELYNPGDAPDFENQEIAWCLFDGSLLVIVWCPGQDYTLLKDAESFVYDLYGTRLNELDNYEDYPTFRIHNELREGSGMPPQSITRIDTKPHNFGIIYRQDELESIYQFYEKDSTVYEEISHTSENVFLRRLKTASEEEGKVQYLKSWGSEQYQVVHMYWSNTNVEEIKIYKVSFPDNDFIPIGMLKLDHSVNEDPQNWTPRVHLNFDVYQTREKQTIYMTAEEEGASTLNKLFEHNINPDSPQDALNGFSKIVETGTVCGSEVIVTDSIIVIACKKTNQIKILRRDGLISFGEIVDLTQNNEVFYDVDGLMNGSNYKPKFMHVISREVHNYIIYSTYNDVQQTYRLKVIEVILPKDQPLTQVNEMGNYVLDYLWQEFNGPIFTSNFPFQFAQLYFNYIVHMTIYSPNQLTIVPFCSLDQFRFSNYCYQCPLGSFGVSSHGQNCYSCFDLEGTSFSSSSRDKMEFYCKHKIGQISSSNRGEYNPNDWPTNQEQIDDDSNEVDPDQNKDGSNDAEDFSIIDENQLITEDASGISSDSIITILVIVLAIIPLLIIIIIIVVKVKMNKRPFHEEEEKPIEELLLEISRAGTNARRCLVGPRDQPFDNFDLREQTFVKISFLAPEKAFGSLSDHSQKFQSTCAICVDDFIESDLVRQTQCKHVFHSACIMTWAKQKLWSDLRRVILPDCPNCKFPLQEQKIELAKNINKPNQIQPFSAQELVNNDPLANDAQQMADLRQLIPDPNADLEEANDRSQDDGSSNLSTSNYLQRNSQLRRSRPESILSRDQLRVDLQRQSQANQENENEQSSSVVPQLAIVSDNSIRVNNSMVASIPITNSRRSRLVNTVINQPPAAAEINMRTSVEIRDMDISQRNDMSAHRQQLMINAPVNLQGNNSSDISGTFISSNLNGGQENNNYMPVADLQAEIAQLEQRQQQHQQNQSML